MRSRTRKSSQTSTGSQDAGSCEPSAKPLISAANPTPGAGLGTTDKKSEANLSGAAPVVPMDTQAELSADVAAKIKAADIASLEKSAAGLSRSTGQGDKEMESQAPMEDDDKASKAEARLQRKRKQDAFVLSDDEGEAKSKKARAEPQATGSKEQKSTPLDATAKPVQASEQEQKRKAQQQGVRPTQDTPAAASAASQGNNQKMAGTGKSVEAKKAVWDPTKYMRAAISSKRPTFGTTDNTTKESIEGAINKALGGTQKGFYRGVTLAFDGVLGDNVGNYTNGFCSALTKGLNELWYACGRYAKAGEQTYNRCNDHPSAPPAIRLCLKNVRARDLNSKDGAIRDITLVYPELLHQLVGDEVYQRCDAAIGSLDPDARQRGINELQEALYNSTAFTTGFECSVSLGWKGAQAGEGRLQSIFLRPGDPKHIEVSAPGAGWQIHPKKDHTVYAVRIEEPAWGPSPKGKPAPVATMDESAA